MAIVLVSVLAEISLALSSAGYQRFESSVIVGYFLISVNATIAVAGLWTRQQAAWLAYLVASITLAIMVGAVTPLSVLGMLARLLTSN
jgi:hypothetical protein